MKLIGFLFAVYIHLRRLISRKQIKREYRTNHEIICRTKLPYPICETEFPILGFRYQVSDIRLQILGFRYQVSDIRFQILGFRYQVSDTRFQILGFRHQVSDTRFKILGFRYQVSYTRFQILGFRYQVSDTRFHDDTNFKFHSWFKYQVCLLQLHKTSRYL